MLRRLIIAFAWAFAALVATPTSASAEGPAHPHDYAYSFDGPFGSYDMAAVQRGFAVYKQVCASCHSMRHLAYRHLGEEGGPFAAYRVVNHETGEETVTIGLQCEVRNGQRHCPIGELLDISDNPFVRAIADDVQIADIDSNTGETLDRPGRISDYFRPPYANEAAARAANNGAYPPDLSEIVLARHGGADYLHSLLTGYTGEQRGVQYVNPYFPGGLISMPPPLAEGVLTYDDGTEATVEQMASDVTHFLQWAADPHMEARKSLGLQVIIFLLVLTALVYIGYRQVWRGQKH